MTSKERIELRKWAMDHAFAYSGKNAKINDIVDMANGLFKWAIKEPKPVLGTVEFEISKEEVEKVVNSIELARNELTGK